MRIHTLTTWEIRDDGFVLVADYSYEYFGPIALAKKGRKEQEQLIRDQREQALREESRRTDQFARAEQETAGVREQQRLFEEERGRVTAEKEKADALIAPYERLAPNQMTEASSAQYASDLENIGRTYGAVKEAGLRTLNTRGFGRAPSGFTSSFLSTTDRNRANEETDAFRQGLARTEAHGLTALNYRTGQMNAAEAQQRIRQQEEDLRQQDVESRRRLGSEAGSVAGQRYEGSSQAALRRSQMGSTFGDVAGGISQIAGAASSFLPGGGLSSLSKRLVRKPTGGTWV